MTDIEQLKQVPLFSSMDAQEISDVRAIMDENAYAPGQVIFREGDRGEWLYIVTDGEVEVLKSLPGHDAQPLRRLGPGECFGEIALVSDTARSATVRALSPTNVLAVDREAFQAMFASLPPLKGFVEQLIASRNA